MVCGRAFGGIVRLVPEQEASLSGLLSWSVQSDVEIAAGQHIQRMAALGIEDVVDQLDVDQPAFQPYACEIQAAELQLDAEAVLLDGRVFKELLELQGAARGGDHPPAVGDGCGDARQGGEDARPLRLRDEGAAAGLPGCNY